MGFFTKKMRVTKGAFIEEESTDAIVKGTKNLEKVLSASTVPIQSVSEVSCLAGYLQVLAMSLNRLDQNVIEDYVSTYSKKLDEKYEDGSGSIFLARVNDYMASYNDDYKSNRRDYFPSLMNIALQNIYGTSHESVAAARLGLVMTFKPLLKLSRDLYAKLKIVG